MSCDIQVGKPTVGAKPPPASTLFPRRQCCNSTAAKVAGGFQDSH